LTASPNHSLKAHSVQEADCIRLVPHQHKGLGDIVKLDKKKASDPSTYTFNYQRDTYSVSTLSPLTFSRLPYPSSGNPPLSTFLVPKTLTKSTISEIQSLYGDNEFDIPIPSFTELFGEHATAPFFVFQIFCVALWCLDEYWYYSLFTLFMLIVFECTVVWQVSSIIYIVLFQNSPSIKRVRTLTEFRTMSVAPYPIQCYRDSKWIKVQTNKLLPGDVVSVGTPFV